MRLRCNFAKATSFGPRFPVRLNDVIRTFRPRISFGRRKFYKCNLKAIYPADITWQTDVTATSPRRNSIVKKFSTSQRRRPDVAFCSSQNRPESDVTATSQMWPKYNVKNRRCNDVVTTSEIVAPFLYFWNQARLLLGRKVTSLRRRLATLDRRRKNYVAKVTSQGRPSDV